ncbi:hypothetical protein ACFL4F_00405 [Candidatus Margulisiibacteriota bacterium]
MKIDKGNILIIFIMLLGLSFMVFSISTVVTTRVREAMFRTAESQAFYIAEAGLNKAIWYLVVPVSLGGKGRDWRGSTTEAFSGGSYSVTVQDAAVFGEVFLTSTGEVGELSRTITQLVDTETFPAAFDYAMFSGNYDFTIEGKASISGDIFANGSISLTGTAQLINGEAYHSEGYAVSGNATDGGTPDPVPAMPSMDTTYYDGQISIAEGIAPADQSYVSLNLNGGIVYINGDADISGSGVITGPGTFVCTGKLMISGSPVSDGSAIVFISKGDIEIAGNASLPNSSFYARENMVTTGNVNIQIGTMLASGDFLIDGSVDFRGAVYCANVLTVSGNPIVSGSLVANRFEGIGGGISITYDPSMLPSAPPAGLEKGDPEPIKGTWEEL